MHGEQQREQSFAACKANGSGKPVTRHLLGCRVAPVSQAPSNETHLITFGEALAINAGAMVMDKQHAEGRAEQLRCRPLAPTPSKRWTPQFARLPLDAPPSPLSALSPPAKCLPAASVRKSVRRWAGGCDKTVMSFRVLSQNQLEHAQPCSDFEAAHVCSHDFTSCSRAFVVRTTSLCENQICQVMHTPY